MSPPNRDVSSPVAATAEAAAFVDGRDRPAKRVKSNDGEDAAAVASSSSRAASPAVAVPSPSGIGDGENGAAATAVRSCLGLLFGPLPATLLASSSSSSGDDAASLRELWKAHGFRTSAVSSPRPAVSVYLDSCRARHDAANVVDGGDGGNDNGSEEGRGYLLTCIGMHPDQQQLGHCYNSTTKDAYCLWLFLKRMKSVRGDDMEDERMMEIVSPWERKLEAVLALLSKDDKAEEGGTLLRAELRELADLSSPPPSSSPLSFSHRNKHHHSSSGILAPLLSKLVEIDHSLRTDQLMHEYDRIAYENCTLANACLQRWLDVDVDSGNGGDCGGANGEKRRYEIDQVYLKPSPPGRYLPKYERITIHFKDPNAVEPSKAKLIFMPSLTQVLTARSGAAVTDTTGKDASGEDASKRHPLDAVVDDMLHTTWESLLREGYYVDEMRKESLGPELRKFYMSGLICGKIDGNLPIVLNAHFTPTHPLSLYLRGTAGAGKSSLVRALVPSVHAAISAHADPELLVRFVKQNLNKPIRTLQLELELRPNNNDYSVMSIIQGRRMTLTQSKPGLVLVALEEMPQFGEEEGRDPDQGEVGRLISMRFSGRKGEFQQGERKEAPRNSTKRGISGDATIITIFTSNYDLQSPTLEALQRLDMFKNLKVIGVAPVAGKDREEFSMSYLKQLVGNSLVLSTVEGKKKVTIKQLDIPRGEGDIRPLVRYLRMLSFYIISLMLSPQQPKDGFQDGAGSVEVSVSFDASTDVTSISAQNNNGELASLQLKPGSFQNLYPVVPVPKSLSSRASLAVAELQKRHSNNLKNPLELLQILDFYFARTVLAPTVILSHDRDLIRDLIETLSRSDGVQSICNIDPSGYKMMKSLYDEHNTPNLRDDILQILHGDEASASTQCVAIELLCQTTDAQLQIREIIEDTPSMTAFSTERSALHKDGLLFGVFVEGEITPEIRSRASLVI